ncbi:MAG: alpha/beta hydrolase fold domain-containing protein [Rhodopila sp.]
MTREELQRRIDVEFPLVGSRKEATAFPLNASTLDLNGWPEALVMVAECDVTRDDAEEYARRMTQAGVIVTCIRYNGVIHDFLSLNVLCEASVVRSATAQAIEALHDALYGS